LLQGITAANVWCNNDSALHVNFVKANLPVEEHLKIFSALEILWIMGENNKFSNLNITTGSFLSFAIVGTCIVSNDELLLNYSRGVPNMSFSTLRVEYILAKNILFPSIKFYIV
jgi:hypothetical protein